MKKTEKNYDVDFRLQEYEEFKNDGKEYCKINELERLTTALVYGKSFNGVLITGKVGRGKTSLVQQFAQQNLAQLFNVQSIKIIQFFPETLQNAKSNTAGIELMKKIYTDNMGSSIILYCKIYDKNLLADMINFCNMYFEKIKSRLNIPVLKIIIECTLIKNEDDDFFNFISGGNFIQIKLYAQESFESKMKYFQFMVKNLSKEYGIEISNQMIFYAATVIKGYFPETDNLHLFQTYFEELFATACKMKSKTISENEIRKAFSEWFENLDKTCKENLYQVAIHESGHTLMVMLLKNYRKLEYVTIVPGVCYKGLTSHSKIQEPDEFAENDRHWFIMKMALNLAGREAERLTKGKEHDNIGADLDLENANTSANDMLRKIGISKALGENFAICNNEEITENLKIRLEHEKTMLIKEASFYTAQQVRKHQDFIKELADCLLKQLMVSGDEVRKLWNKHLKELDEQ